MSQDPTFAYVLFVDIVGYSRELTPTQADMVQLLLRLTRQCPTFRQARQRRKVVAAPSGDGFALAFLDAIGSPFRCAQELAPLVAQAGQFRLRMAVHFGPVEFGPDISGDRNVYGEGVNVAARALGCGEPGELIVTQRAYEIAEELEDFAGHFEPMGTEEVKHGVDLDLYRLVSPTTVREVPLRFVEQAKRIHAEAAGDGKTAIATVEMIARRLRRIRRDFLTGLCLFAAIEGVHEILAHVSFGEKRQLGAYEQCNGQIRAPAGRLGIRVLDLGNGFRLKHEPERTDMAQVAKIVEAMRDQGVHPKAIGFDLDFTPYGEPKRYPDANFAIANELAKFDPPVPSFLSVRVADVMQPENWLGSSDSRLVNMVVHPYMERFDPSARPAVLGSVTIDTDRGKFEVPSLSDALAESVRRSGNRLLDSTMLTTPYGEPLVVEGVEDAPKLRFQAVRYFLNPSALEQIERETMRIPNVDALALAPLSELDGQVVLIGRIIPGEDIHHVGSLSTEGVNLHALGFVTKARAPVREFQPWLGIVLSAIASLTVLTTVYSVRRRHITAPHEVSDERLKRWFTWGMIGLTVAASIVLVRAFSILWTDFLLVAFGLVIDPVLEPKLHHLYHDLKFRVQSFWRRNVLSRKESS